MTAQDRGEPAVAWRNLIVRASSWSLLGRFAAQALRLGSSVVLARLLFPDAFGLVAIVGAFTAGMAMFTDIGVGANVVYSKRAGDPDFLNTAWTVQVLRGVLVSIGVALLAIPGARLYGEPELAGLLAVAGLARTLDGLQSIATHTQRRKLDLGPAIRIDLASQVISIPVIVIWAYLEPSAWALVAGTLLSAGLRAWFSHLFLPNFPHQLMWSAEHWREINRFGIWIFFSSILTFLSVQGDRLLLGYLLGPAGLGVYYVATRFTDSLRDVQGQMSRTVFFPVFSEIARSNPAGLVDRYYRMRLWNDAGFLTLVGLLGSCADLVVRLLYDSRYADAGWILQWLSIQAGMGFMLTSAETLLFSVGLTYFGFARSLARCLWVFAGIPLGWHLAGLPGVVVAVATSEIPVMLVLWTGLVRHGYLRILSELRAFAIWGAAAAVGALLSGLVR